MYITCDLKSLGRDFTDGVSGFMSALEALGIVRCR